MVDIDDTLGNLRDYFSSQPYQQMTKNITFWKITDCL